MAELNEAESTKDAKKTKKEKNHEASGSTLSGKQADGQTTGL